MIWPRAALSSVQYKQRCYIFQQNHRTKDAFAQKCGRSALEMEIGFVKIPAMKPGWRWSPHRQMFCCIFGVAAGVKGKPTRWEWTCCRVSFGDDDTDKETGGPAEDIKIHTGSEQDGRDLKWIWWSSSSMQKKRRFRGQMFGATGEQTTERERWRQLICCRDQRRHGRKTCSDLSVYLTPKFPLTSCDMSALLLCLATCHSPHHPSIHP